MANQTQMEFKYNFETLIRQRVLSVMDIGDFTRILATEHGISERTFYRDKKIKAGSTFSIPMDRLQTYADLFGVDIADLTNAKRKRVKPISKRTSAFAKKIGLKKAS